jgi:hypothetical protein
MKPVSEIEHDILANLDWYIENSCALLGRISIEIKLLGGGY